MVQDHLRSNLGIISSLGIIYSRGSFAVLYITENKNDTNFKKNNTKTEWFLMHFRASRFQFFLGGMPPDPLGERPCGPFSGHSCLLHLQWLLITKVTETPGVMFVILFIPFADLLLLMCQLLGELFKYFQLLDSEFPIIFNNYFSNHLMAIYTCRSSVYQQVPNSPSAQLTN